MFGKLTYHSGLGVWVLFGGNAGRVGEHSKEGKLVSDTWAYDAALNTWTEVKTGSAPATNARQAYALVYDQALQKCILIGYRYPPVETWTLKLTAKK